jgi:hypothetical protein
MGLLYLREGDDPLEVMSLEVAPLCQKINYGSCGVKVMTLKWR